MNTLLPSTPIAFFHVYMSLHFSRFSGYSSDELLEDSLFFLAYFRR